MPDSPRQLIQKGKIEEARRAFAKIRRDLLSHEVVEEFGLMRAQIEFEAERRIPTIRETFKIYRHRALVLVRQRRSRRAPADTRVDALRYRS
jgi:hypothetical protein